MVDRLLAKCGFGVALFAIFLYVTASYGQRIEAYFWHDDYSALYGIIQGSPSPFPYQVQPYLFGPLYNIIGLEYKWYAIISILLVIVATVLIFWLGILLYKNVKIAFLSSLAFPNAYVGQEEINEFIASGLRTLMGLDIFLLALVCFIKYLRSRNVFYFIATCILTFATLEVGAHRYPLILAIFIISDWFFSPKQGKYWIGIVQRNLIFIFLFLLEYVFHISKILIDYPIDSVKLNLVIGSLETVNFYSIANAIGTFWNVLFPRFYQDQYILFLHGSMDNIRLLAMSSLPLILFTLFNFLLIGLLRFSTKKTAVFALLFLLMSGLWLFIVKFFYDGYLTDTVSVLNGGILLLFLFSLILIRLPRSLFNVLFYLLLFVNLTTFIFYTGGASVLNSTHRYLFSISAFLPFIMTFFVTEELYTTPENKTKKMVSRVVFFLPVLLIVGLHFSAGVGTQSNLVKNYSYHAKRFFRELREYIPELEKGKIIYSEGASKQLNDALGDAARVGILPSEAAYAAHYKEKMDKVILAQSLEEIPTLLSKHPELNVGDVHTFVYTSDGLNDTSLNYRNLLRERGQIEYVMMPSLFNVLPVEAFDFLRNDSLAVKTTYHKFSELTLGVFPRIELVPEDVKTQIPYVVEMRIKASLSNNLDLPYYHLFDRPEGAPRELWNEIVSWEAGQCKEGRLNGAFECVTDKKDLSKITSIKEGDIRVSWEYDTFGHILANKSEKIEVKLDDSWHVYKFTIPAGGQYLKKLYIDYISFPGNLEIGAINVRPL